MFKRSEVEKNAIEYFNDSLTANVWLDKYALKISNDEFVESSPDDTIKRLARELHRIEQKYPNPLSYIEIYELLSGYNKFVLGGSCLFGIGNNLTLSTLGNCFVVDSPVDSYGGIFKTDQELAQLMKRRGGVGVDLSTIRNKGSRVTNAAGSSTGIVPFAERFSNTTREVAQEGRRGALMLSLDIEHPDAEEFITCKDDLTKITGANISVRIPDSFMKNIDSSKNSQIWSKLIHQAWKNGEPGVLFWDKIIQESPSDCYEGFKTIGTNPCSELPLCAYDSCRLSAVNLFAYIKNPFTTKAHFSYREFVKDVTNMQRLMDNIIDLEEEKITNILNKINNDPEDWDIKLPEYKTWSAIRVKLLRGRRTGLGLMGLADAIAAMNLKYGSNKSIKLSNEIVKALAMASYTSSIIMAKERGSFLCWNRDIEKDNPFIKRIKEKLSSEQLALYNEFGRRNIANLTIAPTGSISMLARVSSGIEPVFALSYNRKRKVSADNPNKTIQDKVGDWWEEYTVLHPKYQQWLKESFNKSFEEFLVYGETIVKESSYYKATAHDIDPYTKLKLQSIIQPWIDHSISVTYNLPENITEDQVSKLYYTAWFEGLKGLTVYREGSREGVLTTKKEIKFNKYDAPKRPKDLICDVHNIMAKGRPWKVFIGLMDNEPYEVFAVNGKIDRVPIDRGILRKVKQGRYDLISLTGETIVEDITHNMTQDEEAFTRTISWALRHGAKLEFGIEQLSKSEGDITSFSKAIARTLRKYVKDGTIRGIKCPNCGAIMVSEGGCPICKNCGTTKCD